VESAETTVPSVDANKDGIIDVLVSGGTSGNLTLLNGRTGVTLYTFNVYASNVTAVAIVSDVDGDGTNETAIRTDSLYLVSFKAAGYTIIWKQNFGSEGIGPIQDVNLDGYKDIVAAAVSEHSAVRQFRRLLLRL
jgi:hypothetical protein